MPGVWRECEPDFQHQRLLQRGPVLPDVRQVQLAVRAVRQLQPAVRVLRLVRLEEPVLLAVRQLQLDGRLQFRSNISLARVEPLQ